MRLRLTLLLAMVGLMSLPACRRQESSTGGDPGASSLPTPSPPPAPIRIGFTPSLGAAPLIVARARGLFEKHRLDVSLEFLPTAQAVAQRLASGHLDAGVLPPAAALAISSGARSPQIPCVLARNAGHISVSAPLWEAFESDLLRDAQGRPVRPIHADALVLAVQRLDSQATPIPFQIDSLLSTPTYALRYWLAAAGIVPDTPAGGPLAPSHPFLGHARVRLSTETPAPTASSSGHAGAVWKIPTGQKPVISVRDIVRDLPSEVLASRRQWISDHREAAVGTVAALIEAGVWLDARMDHRRSIAPEMARLLALDPASVESALAGRPGQNSGGSEPFSNRVTFAENASAAPDRSTFLWILGQMRRWKEPGVADLKEASDLESRLADVLRADLFSEAVTLSEENLTGLSARLDENAPVEHVLDGHRLHPRQAASYFEAFGP